MLDSYALLERPAKGPTRNALQASIEQSSSPEEAARVALFLHHVAALAQSDGET